MPHPTADHVQELVGLEYDLISIGADLDNLQARLRELPIPGGVAAARRINIVRKMLGTVLAQIDPAITAQVREWEAQTGRDAMLWVDAEEAAPF